MSTIQTLRAFVNQRLTAAVEEIFGLLETTISNYEDEIDRQRRLLEDVFKSETHTNRADIQELTVSKEEQHEWSTGLDQQDPELPHIKEEQEQLSEEGKQPQGQEDNNVTKFPFTAVPAKSEDYEEKAQTSQLHQTQTEESKVADTPACTAQHMETDTDCSHQLLSSNCRADIQEPIVSKEEQHEWSTGLDQQDPELPHIKEEQEQLSEEGKQPQGQEDNNVTKFPFTAVPAKSEDYEEKAQTSQLHQTQTEESKVADTPACTAQQMETDTDCSHQLLSSNCRADIQEPIVSKEEQHEWSTGLDQQDPELPHIKEEQEQLSEEGKQPQGQEDNNVPEFPLTAVPAKSEDYEEKAQTSQLHQTQTEESKVADTPACTAQHMETDNDCSHQLLSLNCSESETEDYNDNRKDTRQRDSGLETLNRKHTLNHNKSHNHERPYGCTVCGKGFGSKGNLSTHMRSHTGEKPFTCTVCDKSFSTKVNLQTHMRSHTGEKPFSCTVCNKSYSQKKTLVIHFRSHTGERPFSCSFCGKRFSEQGALKRHYSIHAREKAHSCSVCGRYFALLSQVKSHKCTGVSSNK